ncbi:unnamed protein product, partial [Mesorhabditis belari]|uniref:F-box domain-containing protein n=1 Tax=Mesorhabditis belari TaxID=2138241 RepID=A0AAF3ECG7_9BILA
MESLEKEQQNRIPTSSVNFLEALPDVVFDAVMEYLPGGIIESTVRQLSKNCYERVELRRARLPPVHIDQLYFEGNKFGLYRRPSDGERTYDDDEFDYRETIDPVNLIEHLEYLKDRISCNNLALNDVNWDMFANCKFECEGLHCGVWETTLSPERFMDIFGSIRPTRRLAIFAYGDNKSFPVPSGFFANKYAIGLQKVTLLADGNAMVDPLTDPILLGSTLSKFSSHFPTSTRCTLDGILPMIREWYTSERQIDKISLYVVGREVERQNFYHNLPQLQHVNLLCKWGDIISALALKRANGDIVGLTVSIDKEQETFSWFSITRLVPGPRADLYMAYDHAE